MPRRAALALALFLTPPVRAQAPAAPAALTPDTTRPAALSPAMPVTPPAATGPLTVASPAVRVDTLRPRPSTRPAPVFTRAALLARPALPVAGGRGAAVLHAQVLLDAAGFSPGMLDGEWNENTRFALRAFREAYDLSDGTDVVDAETYALLRRLGNDRPAVTTYPLSAADVRGPYRPVPEGVAAKAKAECLCYESLLERLSERFHARPALLRALNPGVDFAAATPGAPITVPNTWRLAPRRRVARVVVTKGEGAVRGVDATGTTVFWLPATVGSTDTPSPHGTLAVESVTRDPQYRWDPAVLKDVSRREPVRMLPPGPNSLVGLVWVALSRPHVGIHGTPYPESVGYAASHGCVRLTNWDAVWFSRLARPGLAVEFQ